METPRQDSASVSASVPAPGCATLPARAPAPPAAAVVAVLGAVVALTGLRPHGLFSLAGQRR